MKHAPVLLSFCIAAVVIGFSVAAMLSGPDSELGELLLPIWALATLTVVPAPSVASLGRRPGSAWIALVGVVITSGLFFVSETMFSAGVDEVAEVSAGSSLPWLFGGVLAWISTWLWAGFAAMLGRKSRSQMLQPQ